MTDYLKGNGKHKLPYLNKILKKYLYILDILMGSYLSEPNKTKYAQTGTN